MRRSSSSRGEREAGRDTRSNDKDLCCVAIQAPREGIAADYDAEGRLAGLEILDAKKRLGDPAAFKQVILEDVAVASPN